MEITIPRYFVDSDDDSSSGTPSPVLSGPRAAPRVTSTDPLPEWQCKYTGKICPHPRARKTNGKLHRLCEEHRVRANVNQRRLQQKRREARDSMRSPYSLSPVRAAQALDHDGDEDWLVSILRDDEPLDHEAIAMAALESTSPEPLTAPCELTDEDVETLTVLFTTSISSDSTDNDIYDVMCGALQHKTS